MNRVKVKQIEEPRATLFGPARWWRVTAGFRTIAEVSDWEIAMAIANGVAATAEQRADIRALFDFHRDLRYVTVTGEERADLMKCAIQVGQVGLTSEQLPVVVSNGMTHFIRAARELNLAKSHTTEQIERRIAEIIHRDPTKDYS